MALLDAVTLPVSSTLTRPSVPTNLFPLTDFTKIHSGAPYERNPKFEDNDY